MYRSSRRTIFDTLFLVIALLWAGMLIAAPVAMRAAWLLPASAARVAAVVSGKLLPPSQHHTLYAVAEVAKLYLLAVAGFSGFRAAGQRRGE